MPSGRGFELAHERRMPNPLILAICPTTELTAPDVAATATVSPAFGSADLRGVEFA
jgi:hypothetical protein